MAHIGIIEDDQNILTTLQISLQSHRHTVSTFFSAESFLANPSQFDLLIIDVNLPDMDGIQLCKKIRETSAVPILILTAKTDEQTAVSSLSSGASDFIRKPFGLNELKLRIDKALQNSTSQKRYQYMGLELNEDHRTCTFQGKAISLTQTEFDILALFLSSPGRVFSRENILLKLDLQSETIDRTLDSHISRIRQKLKLAGVSSLGLFSVYGVGYKIDQDNQ